MQVIRNDKGEVTKVIITEKEFAETSKDYKGEHDGKRSWMPPFDVFGTTCSLTEGPGFEIIDDYHSKKFWVHYSKNNTAKRRNMELRPLVELLPMVDSKCATPLWYVKGEQDRTCNWITYYIYAQIGDAVAVDTTYHLTDYNIEEMKSDAQSRFYKYLNAVSDFGTFMLTQSNWVPEFVLKAYEEIGSPFLPTLQALHNQYVAQRELQHKEYLERMRKREEEEKRKKAEAEAKEQQRLTEEAKKFKAGKRISGDDIVELCRRYGINVHLRTVHNLQQVVREMDRQCAIQYSGTKAKLTGCFKTAETLYDYLQTHEI